MGFWGLFRPFVFSSFFRDIENLSFEKKCDDIVMQMAEI